MTRSGRADLPTTAPAILLVRPPRKRRRWRRWAVLTIVVLLLPVPWQARSDSTLGFAWRLDGRLLIGDDRVDPPGRYSWLSVGRPVLVGELLWQSARSRVDPDAPRIARDLRVGSVSSRPEHVERVAVAVGLRRAGHDLDVGLRVEVSEPLVEQAVGRGLPEHAVVTHVNGIELVDRAAWSRARDASSGGLTFTTEGGGRHASVDDRLPYARVRLVDVAPPGIDAAVGGYGAPWSWLRSLSMGASHGLMVGLTAYASAAADDLAAGRHVAGTGRLLGDGTVGSIGDLPAKARAARRAGADVLLVPASQAHELDDFDAGAMRVLAVATLDDAITQLRATAAG